MNRRAAVVIGLGLASLLALANVVTAPMPGGPLAESVPSNLVTFPVSTDTPFTYGGLQLRNSGSQPAVLDRVLLQGDSAGLEIAAAYVLPVVDAAGGLWFSYQRFPPPGLPVGNLRALSGYEIAAGAPGPDGAVQVLLVLSVAGPGEYGFDALAVDYRVAGRRFRAAFPFAMRVCVAAVPC